MLYQDSLTTQTKEGISLKDITGGIREIVKKSKVEHGICLVFLKATTAGLFINENERMLQEDIKKFLKAMADDSRIYHHPSNASSHVRANHIAKDITIPISDGDLNLGTWQSVFLVEFDKEPREREIVITIIGQ